MKSSLAESVSDSIRNHVRDSYLKAAIRKGETVFTVNVGTVHKALGLVNRVPQVCAALESRKLLDANQLRIVSRTGPPSGRSTTVTFTYEINPHERMPNQTRPNAFVNPLATLRGIAKDLFKQLGGGENFIKSERNTFTEK